MWFTVPAQGALGVKQSGAAVRETDSSSFRSLSSVLHSWEVPLQANTGRKETIQHTHTRACSSSLISCFNTRPQYACIYCNARLSPKRLWGSGNSNFHQNINFALKLCVWNSEGGLNLHSLHKSRRLRLMQKAGLNGVNVLAGLKCFYSKSWLIKGVFHNGCTHHR